MNIKKIIQEEVDDFGWAEDIRVSAGPEDLEVGVTYMWTPDYEKWGPTKPPEWMEDYNGRTLKIIKKEPWNDGVYVGQLVDGWENTDKVVNMASTTNWVKFAKYIEVGTINESNDFDWTEEIGSNKYNIGDGIINMTGYLFSSKPSFDAPFNTVNGYDYGEIREINNEHMTYGIQLFNHRGARGLSDLYYFKIEEIDGR